MLFQNVNNREYVGRPTTTITSLRQIIDCQNLLFLRKLCCFKCRVGLKTLLSAMIIWNEIFLLSLS